MAVEATGRRTGALAGTAQELANFTMGASFSIVRPGRMAHHLQWVRVRTLGTVKRGIGQINKTMSACRVQRSMYLDNSPLGVWV